MGVRLVAAVWGLAEATVFFIVPDVWLSLAARERLRPGLVACLWALGGALLGGGLMYFWGAVEGSTALAAVDRLPAISAAMIERVHGELQSGGATAVLFGPLSGTPYKLYALQAHRAGLDPAMFTLISIPARLSRFFLVTLVSHYALKLLVRAWPGIHRIGVVLAAWVVFYFGYFSIMPA